MIKSSTALRVITFFLMITLSGTIALANSSQQTFNIEDRTKPRYEVYKNSIAIDVPVDLQWMIYDFSESYSFDEAIIYGLIIMESTFNPSAKGNYSKSFGLAQIKKFWLTTKAIARFEENAAERDLLDPYDNLLTLMEIWSYARDTYSIDTTTIEGMKDLLYYHNTGQYIKNVTWEYSNQVFLYASELVRI